MEKTNFKTAFKSRMKLYFIDAMGAMALGLFASLLIGTIFGTLATYTHLDFLNTIAGYAKSATGMAIGVAIAYKLSAHPLVIFSCAAVGAMANAMGAIIASNGGAILKWAVSANDGSGPQATSSYRGILPLRPHNRDNRPPPLCKAGLPARESARPHRR